MMDDLAKLPPAVLPADWSAPGRVHAFTTQRTGGSSIGPWGNDLGVAGLNLGLHCGDDRLAVLDNRSRLRQLLPVEPQWLNQVHGTDLFIPGSTVPDEPPRADAAVTDQAGVVLAILTADCMPVFFTDLDGSAIGICHAGWRGMAGGIIETTLARLRQLKPQARGWMAHLGPTIGPDHFEVGDDVRVAFCQADPPAAAHFRPGRAPGKYWADLYGLARRRLQSAGLKSISAGAYCTYRDRALFYSYRRDRDCGRMASVIWIQ